MTEYLALLRTLINEQSTKVPDHSPLVTAIQLVRLRAREGDAVVAAATAELLQNRTKSTVSAWDQNRELGALVIKLREWRTRQISERETLDWLRKVAAEGLPE